MNTFNKKLLIKKLEGKFIKKMKNALPELVYTREIQNEKADPKTFYKFATTIEQIISQNEVIITPNIRMKLINQSKA